MSYIGNEPVVSATRTITEISATAGQTVFVANGGYTVGYIDVFVNGVQLQTSDFTATNGSSVTLNSGATAGDDVRLVAWGTFQSSSALTANNPSYTGTLTGGTGVINIGSGQFYKDASGNVGIGTSSPSGIGKLINIVGSSTTTPSTYTAGNSDNSQFVTMYSGSLASGDVSAMYFNNGLRFATASTPTAVGFTERMRIDSSGNLLVGTTTTLDGGGTTQGIQVSQSGSNIWTGWVKCNDRGIVFQSTSSGSFPIYFLYGTSSVGNINTTATSTNYATSSDYRLKDNIAPMTGALDRVAKLKPVTYSWKADGSDGEGFIAHELQAVVPDCVTGEKDGVRIVDELDEDGKKIGEKVEPVYQGIDTSFLVATLTAAIQEQQTIINDLKSRIEVLENK